MNAPTRPSSLKSPQPPASQANSAKIKFETIQQSKNGDRILLYGPGGIGKTTLACMLPGKCAFVDADESLGKLKPQLVKASIPVPVNIPMERSWRGMKSALEMSGYEGIKNIIIDAHAPVELWCVQEVISTVTKDNGKRAANIEDYGFGKGWRHNYDMFLPLLGVLDSHIRAGRNICIIAHDETSKVPNPAGVDYIRWEPKAQNSPNASIRYRMKEWADHVLFLAYDISVEEGNGLKKTGKATGAGFRTLHTAEQPYFMAKSRSTSEDFPIVLGESPWEQIILSGQ